jgi:hypothetical protein
MQQHAGEQSIAEPVAYGIDQAVQATGIGRTGLYEAIRSGQLRARKYGKRTLILAPDLGAFLSSLPEKATREHAVTP